MDNFSAGARPGGPGLADCPGWAAHERGIDSTGGRRGQFKPTDTNFADLTSVVRPMADRTAEGRVVSLPESGYNLTGPASAAPLGPRTITGRIDHRLRPWASSPGGAAP